MIAVVARAQAPSSSFIAHEWGTITTHHLPDGTPKGRLNLVEPSEILPNFVHVFRPTNVAMQLVKSPLYGINPGEIQVTMRLETPVIYFYPMPAGKAMPDSVNVHAQFRGGVLNEFYPAAKAAVAPDDSYYRAKTSLGEWDGKSLNRFVLSSLLWENVRLSGKPDNFPKTEDPVWLAPRKTDATPVKVGDEDEKYLFYRGVANLEALLCTRHKTETGGAVTLELFPTKKFFWLPADKPDTKTGEFVLKKVWVADLRGGKGQYQTFADVKILQSSPDNRIAAVNFRPEDASEQGLATLRAEMKAALIAEGLFDAEAEAMLTTWQHSYFRKEGVRVFYIVPKRWTDYFLSLEITPKPAAPVIRAYIGRIDLVSK